VEKQEHPARVACGSDRPFAGHTSKIDRGAFYIVSDRPNRSDFVKTPAAF
jgi:hypothetical protein